MNTKSPAWSDVKRRLAAWDPPALLGLLRGLYELSAENREFVAARLASSGDSGSDSGGKPGGAPGKASGGGAAAGMPTSRQVLDSFRRRIRGAFSTSRGEPYGPDLRAVRRVIATYRKAAGDLAGVVELLVYHVEVGTAFTLKFGDIDEAFYDSLCSTLDQLVKVFRSPQGRPLYPPVPRAPAAPEPEGLRPHRLGLRRLSRGGRG